jgi:mannose-1-phosphate guanylyltransferase
MKTIILCGGAGTRLWPISRKTHPKQFAKIFNNQSLFEKTIERHLNLADSYSIIVNQAQLPICQEQVLKSLNSITRFLVEPVGRNTAAAIALAAFDSDPEEILLVLPSDHLIAEQSLYESCVKKASELAANNKLVTFGIQAKYPETGYGYIEANGYDVLSFKEKPDLVTAQNYLKSGNYYWNSGMFCFKAKVFLDELEKHANEIYQQAKMTYQNKNQNHNIVNFSLTDMQNIPSNSIDYAVMEKSQIVNVVPSNFYWSDLGSFDSLSDELVKDDHGNSLCDKFYALNSYNNLIINNTSKVITTFDVDDLIIVQTTDALLIGKKGSSQKVKDVFETIKQKHPELLD